MTESMMTKQFLPVPLLCVYILYIFFFMYLISIDKAHVHDAFQSHSPINKQNKEKLGSNQNANHSLDSASGRLGFFLQADHTGRLLAAGSWATWCIIQRWQQLIENILVSDPVVSMTFAASNTWRIKSCIVKVLVCAGACVCVWGYMHWKQPLWTRFCSL